MTVIGEVIGNYRLVAELGKGGMGVVYVAEHVQLGRPAALKMLLPQFSTDEAIVQRFFNEARAASAIDHPGIVEIYEYGTHTDHRAYIVMALLKGETLQQRLAREPMSPAEGATIVAQVASALAAAHARGIVHRDLKPDNIFLIPNELMPFGVQAKLLDFGIAKLADERAAFKTQTGSLIGTPAYMSPEQCMGRSDVDHRTDLYALGCILFHVLCNRPPFVCEGGAGAMIAAHLRDPAPDPRTFNPYVSDVLAAIVLRLLEKEPAARLQSAAEVRDALATAGVAVSVTRPVSAARAPVSGPYTGPEAYHPTTAPTTSSGSAAEVIAQPAPRKRAGLWIAIAGLAIAGGVAAVVVVTSQRGDSSPSAAPAVAVATPDASAPRVAEVDAASVVVDAATEAAPVADLVPCPPGQARTADTSGHCCWPEQAWSSTKQRCIGNPRCPAGTKASRDEQCVAIAVAPTTPADASPALRFALDGKTFAPGQGVVFRFSQPVPSSASRRAWVTIVEPGKPDTSWGTWEWVPDRARTVTVVAPASPGTYEARLHTDYPARSGHVRHRARLEVTAATAPVEATGAETPPALQRFRVGRRRFAPGQHALLRFPTPMHAARGEQFWVTVVELGANDDAYGAYEYVRDGATTITLAMPSKPGPYEIRLHANYPKRQRNVVHRVRVMVQ